MTRAATKLEPCPFCGGEAHTTKATDPTRWSTVQCRNKGCRVTVYTQRIRLRDAIAAWNRRKP